MAEDGDDDSPKTFRRAAFEDDDFTTTMERNGGAAPFQRRHLNSICVALLERGCCLLESTRRRWPSNDSDVYAAVTAQRFEEIGGRVLDSDMMQACSWRSPCDDVDGGRGRAGEFM